MNLSDIQTHFHTNAQCREYLESVRWNDGIYCAHCGSTSSITKRKDSHIYHCNACNRDLTVFINTIFEHSRLPLTKWFTVIALMLDAKRGMATMQISRHVGCSYATAWYITMRIRCAMVEDIVLDGLIEGDDPYIGGAPRRHYKKAENVTSLSHVVQDGEKLNISNSKRGRGTSKAKVAGLVERKGKVVLKMMETFNTRSMLSLLKHHLQSKRAVVVTDDAKFYHKFDELVQHLIIKHKEAFAQGNVHINTIEGFWSIIKTGIKGQYRSLSKKYLPFYLAEFAYKYNRRHQPKLQFEEYIQRALDCDKCFTYAKPNKPVKQLVYGT